jgi:hypothetical protein
MFPQNRISSNKIAEYHYLKTDNINLNQGNNCISTQYGMFCDITDGTLAINATPALLSKKDIQGELITCENRRGERRKYFSNVMFH